MVKPKNSTAKQKKLPIEDSTTEEKIKQAARHVFTRKGFAATRTRDIAEEAGLNLALLNYYFRSKEKLFDLIMLENMQHFMHGMKTILNNENSTLSQKTVEFVDNYINLLKSQPDLPLFILHELKANPQKFAENIGVKKVLFESHFFKQINEATKGKINPFQLIINMMALTVFPFIACPLLKSIGNLKQVEFDSLMDERRTMIPLWIHSMLKIK
ncbi:MAG: TetR/AcrR family transcriptional regulator [Bacteroidetes bacterium]|nr:TetR/AcrR family transcriptional regulator [Bacteroidota bacterium]